MDNRTEMVDINLRLGHLERFTLIKYYHTIQIELDLCSYFRSNGKYFERLFSNPASEQKILGKGNTSYSVGWAFAAGERSIHEMTKRIREIIKLSVKEFMPDDPRSHFELLKTSLSTSKKDIPMVYFWLPEKENKLVDLIYYIFNTYMWQAKLYKGSDFLLGNHNTKFIGFVATPGWGKIYQTLIDYLLNTDRRYFS